MVHSNHQKEQKPPGFDKCFLVYQKIKQCGTSRHASLEMVHYNHQKEQTPPDLDKCFLVYQKIKQCGTS